MTSDLHGRHALVTGAAGGIGEACARRLAEHGARVTVADVDAAGASRVADDIGGRAWVVDLADTESLEDVELDDVDILVNNAGVQRIHPVHEFPPDEWRWMQRLMVESPFLLARAVLPGMHERGWGRIVNISSAHGLRASAYKSAYVAAKHGLEGLSKVIALEGGPHGVTSNCVNPGYVRTPLVEKQIAAQAEVHGISESEVVERIMLSESVVKRLIEPDEVAELVAYLCGDAAGMITGASLSMDGGWTAR
jgi:3-hydroxybutyrate dehydrogenase